jgi:uncharacterized membrane protein (DUF2068 family)
VGARLVLPRRDAGRLRLVKDESPGSGIVEVIGVFKLLKTVVLVALGVFALVGGHEDLAHALARFTHWTGAFSGRELVQGALARMLSLDDRTIHRLGVASLVYAAVFAVEGIGLIMRRGWAEWLTVVVTGSFIPLEIYELAHRPGPGKVAALLVNVAIVVYLARRRLEARR